MALVSPNDIYSKGWDIAAVTTRIAEGGRVVIPTDHRRALGLRVGDEVLVELEGGTICILTIDEAIRRAQEIIGQYVPEEVSLVDELIAQRWAEAARE